MRTRWLALTLLPFAMWWVTALAVEPFAGVAGPVVSSDAWRYEVRNVYGTSEIVSRTGPVKTFYDASMTPLQITQHTHRCIPQTRMVYRLDERGRVDWVDYYGETGSLETRTKVEHQGNVQHHRTYDTAGRLVASRMLVLDDRERIVRETEYDPRSGAVRSVAQITRDGSGEPVLVEIQGEGDVLTRLRYTYVRDGMDAVIERTRIVRGQVQESLLIGISLVERDGYGNWTLKHTHERASRDDPWVLKVIDRRAFAYR